MSIIIAQQDWPNAKPALLDLAYDESEALPVPSLDLETIIAAHPSGPVSLL